MPTESFHTVIVVGAGIAGLAAARDLLPTFPDLLVVEASDHIGGRVQQARGVLPWPVEVGPEFIHGAQSSLKSLIDEIGCSSCEHAWPDYWYFASERRLKSSSEQDGEVQAVMDTFDSIGQQEYPAQDLSVEQWLRNGGANGKMIGVADACYANDFGCSISQLGLRETILENRRWDSGETYLTLDRPLSSLISHLGRQLVGRTFLQWPLVHVNHQSERILLKSSHGRKLQCRFLVLAVPISILQRREITFCPELPKAKLGALSRIKMSNAVKVRLQEKLGGWLQEPFISCVDSAKLLEVVLDWTKDLVIIVLDKPIWPHGFFDVVCPGCFIPEFWVTKYPAEEGYRGTQDLHGIIGFACGLKAELMSSMRKSAIVRASLAQLDDIFGSESSSGASRHPATSAFVRAHIVDWSKIPFIGGAYSYPSLGAEIGDRDKLAEPIDRHVFFAGEATHPAVNPCLQAAFDTGKRAASQVLEAATQSKL